MRFTAIGVSDQSTCGLHTSGAVYCWGSDGSGILGVASPPITRCGYTSCSPSPLPVSGGFTFKQIAVGRSTACGVTTSGVGKCWGIASGANLGGDTSYMVTAATPRSVILPASSDSTRDVIERASPFGNCGVTSTHQLTCWGGNSWGQAGIGAMNPRVLPTPVASSTPLHGVAIGGQFACALDAVGAALCWGLSVNGSLGTGTAPGAGPCPPSGTTALYCYTSPTPVSGGILFVSLSASTWHVCGLTKGGDAYCWGYNSAAQIGIGAFPAHPLYVTAPAPVDGGLHFSMVSAAESYTCGLSTDGGIWCWGANGRGQLGVAPTDAAQTFYGPIRVVPVTGDGWLPFVR